MRDGMLTKRTRTPREATVDVPTTSPNITITAPAKPEPIPFAFDQKVSDLVLAAVGKGGEMLSSDIEADVLALNSREGRHQIPGLLMDDIWGHIKHHVSTGDILRAEVYRDGSRFVYSANPNSGGIIMARKSNPVRDARARLAKNPSTDWRIPPVGSKIEKTYKDMVHIVTVEADGFQLDGKTFKSLTAAAKHITGYAAISGHQFFGLWHAPGKAPKVASTKAPAKTKVAREAKAARKPKAKGTRKRKAARTAKAKGKTSKRAARKF